MNILPCVEKKVIIITGGNSGLGFSYAKMLAQYGAYVAICGHSLSQLQKAVNELALDGIRVFSQQADVTDELSVQKFVHAVTKCFGRIDVLINNAGVLFRRTPEETRTEEWDRTIDTNVKGTFLFSREVGTYMIQQRSGSIINVSSIAAKCALDRRLAYCTSKAAVEHFTKVLAYEWSRYGIRVNAIAPGYIASDMNADLRADPIQYQRIIDDVPLRRFGQPQDLHGTILFLCSDASAFITGQTIYVDGGKTTH